MDGTGGGSGAKASPPPRSCWGSLSCPPHPPTRWVPVLSGGCGDSWGLLSSLGTLHLFPLHLHPVLVVLSISGSEPEHNRLCRSGVRNYSIVIPRSGVLRVPRGGCPCPRPQDSSRGRWPCPVLALSPQSPPVPHLTGPRVTLAMSPPMAAPRGGTQCFRTSADLGVPEATDTFP